MLGGSITVFQLFLINAVFRGAGDAAIAMRVLWLANGINIVLDPCLIYGWGPFPELGLAGAAIATNIGRGVGVLYQLYELFGGKGRIAVRRAHLKAAPGVMAGLLRISIPGMFQYFVAVASWIGLVRIVALFGSEALAGYTIAVRVITFSILPSWGMSNATATLDGQNLGAAKPDRAERSVWLTGIDNTAFLGLVGVFFILFAGRIIGIFTTDSAVIATGTDCLRIISYGYGLYAFGMVIVQAFNGAGDTVTPTIINIFCYWLWEIPLAWVLAMPLAIGTTGVFWAVTISECTLALVGMLVFRRGKWKQAKA
jgi:putative MATE family efflux protein